MKQEKNPSDMRLLNCRLKQRGFSRINYQKGGGGGAFKRKSGKGIQYVSNLMNDPYTNSGLDQCGAFSRRTSNYSDPRQGKVEVLSQRNNNDIMDTKVKEQINMTESINNIKNKGNNKEKEENSVVGSSWITVAKDIPQQSITPKYCVNNKCIKATPINISPLKVKTIRPELDLKKAISVNSIEAGPKPSELWIPGLLKTGGSMLRDMKKQILIELMQINNIPASYFLLGKDYAKNMESCLTVDDVVDLIEISKNSDGDIVIRPRESCLKTAIHKPLASSPQSPLKDICKNAIMVKQIKIDPEKRYKSTNPRTKRAINKMMELTRPSYTPIKERYENTGSISTKVVSNANIKEKPNFNSTVNIKEINKKRMLKDAKLKERGKRSASLHPVRGKIEKISFTIDNAPKVKIWHAKDDHLSKHAINIVINQINEFSALCTKYKTEPYVDKNLILNFSKKLNLGITRSQLASADFFKNKDNLYALKEKLLKTLYNVLNFENEIKQEQIYTNLNCKAFIGNGNNPMMVKSVLRQRFWWNFCDTVDSAHLVWTQWRKPKFIENLPSSLNSQAKSASSSTENSDTDQNNYPHKICNHLEGNAHLGNKKALFYNMKQYYESCGKDPFAVIPLTFHIRCGKYDPQYEKFMDAFHKMKNEQNPENVWIVKPGENTNRGQGITVCKTIDEIKEIIINADDNKRTYIVQKYIEKPLLINKRKFDIRCYGLITCYNGNSKGYFYKEGYLRTASREFTLKNLSAKIIHLTNEAVQVKYEDFGKFEPGNKMTYQDLNKYIETNFPELNLDFYEHLLPQIKKIVTDTMRATHKKLDPNGKQQTFEIFGYDFMIDEDFHVYLIEANINPCLEIKSPVTARIVPYMLDNAFRIALDPLYQPSHEFYSSKKSSGNEILPELKYELIYDSKIDDAELKGLQNNKIIIELDEDEKSDNEYE